jgi:hypothetical protein
MRRRAKEESSDLARLRTGQFIGGAPTCDPCLDFIKGNGEPGPFEFVEAAAVFCNIRAFKIYNRIEECHGFGEDCGNLLPTLGRHLAKAGVGVGIDLKRTTNQIHRQSLSSNSRVSSDS